MKTSGEGLTRTEGEKPIFGDSISCPTSYTNCRVQEDTSTDVMSTFPFSDEGCTRLPLLGPHLKGPTLHSLLRIYVKRERRETEEKEGERRKEKVSRLFVSDSGVRYDP